MFFFLTTNPPETETEETDSPLSTRPPPKKKKKKPPVVVGSALVRLNYTAYRGLRLSNGVSAFLGMRYAAPPLGPLRWRAPVPIDLAAAAAPPDAVEDATEVSIR